VLPVLPADVAVEDVVAHALDSLSVDSALVSVDIAPELPDVHADAGLLERVVANLVQNALRYAPAGEPVQIRASGHADTVELRVIDRGPGIAPADTEAIFEAFRRRDDTPRDGEGVGLGLAIARGFVTAMGGTVDAEQTPGGGATLVVQLPMAGRHR
jgi:two-component system sensor histidine kinase KdpD